ncbi:MAG: class II SORL domain-containing protein [Candidatus Brocadiales bacterium]
MKILGRREFLKGAGLALFVPTLLVEGALAGGPCEACKSKMEGGGAPCPRCAARCGKGAHGGEIDWFKRINRVCDPNNMTATEKKHAPVVSVPSYFKADQTIYLTAQVGETIHVMNPNHWIQWIEVYASDVLISRTEFSPNSPAAIVTVPLFIQKETMVKVLERCNLHGIWESSKMVVPA